MAARPDLAGIRHELRTPINHILGYCQILLEEEDMPERIVTDLHKINAGGKQLLELISRYLDDATFRKVRDWQSVQHELRTPVNHIIGYSELLIEQAADLGQRSLLADLGKIRNAAQQWLGLMESYLLPGTVASDEAALLASHESAPTAPPATTTPTATEPTTALRDPAVSAASLLVVDDDQSSRELLARRFHRAGFRVSTATSAEEALGLVAGRTFDLLLLDCVMPGMDGIQLLEQVRQHKSMTELPAIMVTGRDSSGDVVKALRLGANDYLTKPVDFEVALARVNTHLRLRRAQTELNKRMDEIRRLADDLQLRNEFIKRVFGRYVSGEVVQSVLENPGGLELGGKRRVVTVLMSDLRGFTALAEQMPPEKVVELLNTYLGAMAEVIVETGGTIDEFIGDAILAIFGAPLPSANHAEAAVACALTMQTGLERVNRRLSRLGVPPLEMGIGINTGEVVVGNIGSDKRAKYGVVGAQVNLAGRIQSVTVGGEILVSGATAALLQRALKTDKTFTIWTKGAATAVQLHSVIGLRGQDHLDLPKSDATLLRVPTPPVAVKCFRSGEDKMLSGTGTDAQLSVLSARSGRLITSQPLEIRSDLKLIVLPTATHPGGDCYCKVMEVDPGAGNALVRFTSPLPRGIG
jgi:class 3 adenylate cyclase